MATYDGFSSISAKSRRQIWGWRWRMKEIPTKPFKMSKITQIEKVAYTSRGCILGVLSWSKNSKSVSIRLRG